MPVFTIQRCVVRPEKQGGYQTLMQRFLEFKKENPKLFNEVKSFKCFQQGLGDLVGAYIELWEFDSMADLEKCEMRGSKNKELMKIHQELMLLIEPATLSVNVWGAIT
jgi:hypothetical protein